jgi:hypothetical protein
VGGETLHVAIAVEGTVHAVAPALRRPRGDYLFSAMLPEDAYAFAGARVEVFAVERSPSGPGLLRLPAQLATLQRGLRRHAAPLEGPSSREDSR